MNYNDRILENKAFTFFKQLMYYIVLAVCIILGGCLILVYGFKFTPYEVVSLSMSPLYIKGDLVVVKAQKEYVVGDVLTFNQDGTFDKVTHRLIRIMDDGNGNTIYVCHGDAVGSPNPIYEGAAAPSWEDDVEYVKNMSYEDIRKDSKLQGISLSQIEGKVVTHLNNWGTYINFIGNHRLLVVAMIIAIWCISATVQNELEMKKSLRLI